MKKELEKKDSENDEIVDRLTSKHAHELGEAKYKAQEAEKKLTENQAEFERLRMQLDTQVAAHDLKDQISHLQHQLSTTNTHYKEVQEECERLREENQSVSSLRVYGGDCDLLRSFAFEG